jgi:hypothetical protein
VGVAAGKVPVMPKTLAPLHIFKAGRYVALSGDVVEFSDADVAEIAQSYDPALMRAPLVIGHPKLDAPAYGWVESLQVNAGKLIAKFEAGTVNQEFADLVEQKLYRTISASFYGRTAPGNPTPGKLYLKHVGTLGATPPAVKGLPEPQVVSFSGSQEGVLEFSEWDDITNASLWRRMREWLLEKFGVEAADRVCPAWDVTSLERGAEDALRQAPQADTPAFSDPADPDHKGAPVPPPLPQDDPAKIKERLAQVERELADAKAKEAKAKNDALHAENQSFADGLVSAAKWPKAHAEVLVATLDFAAAPAAQGGQVLEFGEGAERKPLATALRDAVSALPESVHFGEVATAGRAAGDALPGTLDFAAPAGSQVDVNSMALHRKVKAHQAAHPSLSYEGALTAVMAGGR